MTRTLVATVLYSTKGREIYCKSNQINDQQLGLLRNKNRSELEDAGFTIVNLVSPDFPNVRGYAVFYEGHTDEMIRALGKGYRDKY